MKYAIIAFAALSSIAAQAEPVAAPPAPVPPATVCLTQARLQELLTAENTKAVTNYIAQEAQTKAKGVYEEINAAFAPPKPVAPPPPTPAN